MGLLSRPADVVRRLPGADRVLAAHEPPQPDLMCGPFAVRTALAAVLDAPPSLPDLARASRTRLWPLDLPEARPYDAAAVRPPWVERLGLATAESAERSGTDAADLASAVPGVTDGAVAVVPAAGGDAGALARLLAGLAGASYDVGVVANLRTGPVLPPEAGLDVGHFVVLWGLTDDVAPRVAVADSYAELGAPDLPPACRLVGLDALHEALAGRGLLLLVRTEDGPAAGALVGSAGLSTSVWDG